MDGEGGGYINTNVNLKTVKKHIRLILTHLFLLWTLRSLVSSRADYNNPDRTVLAFENWTFLWSNSEGTLSYNLVSELKEVITKLHRSYLND